MPSRNDILESFSLFEFVTALTERRSCPALAPVDCISEAYPGSNSHDDNAALSTLKTHHVLYDVPILQHRSERCGDDSKRESRE